MPAQSQQQQKLFGLALSVKRGETPRSEASEEVLNIVDSMSEKQIKDFAETSHSGLPSKVEQQVREALRELMREMAIEEAELPKAAIPANIKTKLVQAIDKIKDTNLNYNQKLQVIGKIVDSLGIDKKELSKMSSKLKTTLESLNEEDPCWKGYQQIGMKTKNGKEVPNCVPESIQEGKKRFNTKYGVGKSKYVVNYHDGVKKHKDGSDFFDIQIFKNQKDVDTFKKALLQKGFIEESMISEEFSTWEMSFDNMNLGGVQLNRKNKYKVTARNTVEAIKKAAKMAGVKDGQWVNTKTYSLNKL
jgi:hypothetical protein